MWETCVWSMIASMKKMTMIKVIKILTLTLIKISGNRIHTNQTREKTQKFV